MMASPDYTDRDEARNEKAHGSWADVDAGELDAELDEHLIDLPDGRVRLADQHPRDDVVLERAGPRIRAAAQRESERHWSAPPGPTRRMSPTH